MLYVQIIERKDPSVCVLQMEAGSQRQAEQVQRGAAINLDHERYRVIISETPANVQGNEI